MTETNSPLIIGVGELLWDMLPTGKVVGGAPVNTVMDSQNIQIQLNTHVQFHL